MTSDCRDRDGSVDIFALPEPDITKLLQKVPHVALTVALGHRILHGSSLNFPSSELFPKRLP
jgi:hypothetical protein